MIIDIKHIKPEKLDNLIGQEINKFKKNYHKYFLKNKKYVTKPQELDPYPRLIFIPNLGMIGIGRTKKEAKIVSDLGDSYRCIWYP